MPAALPVCLPGHVGSCGHGCRTASAGRMRPCRAPARPQSQAPDSNREVGLMRANRAPARLGRKTSGRGEGRTPTPRRRELLRLVRLPVPPPGHRDRRVPGAGIEPAASAFRARRHYHQQLPRIIVRSSCDTHLHVFGFGAEGGGVEPPRLIARPLSRRLPSPVGLPFQIRSTGGRNRTCGLLLNREAHEPAHASPVWADRGVKCPAGVEPAHPPWQGGRLPIHHGHTSPGPDRRSREWDQRASNPHRPGKSRVCRR